jgi:4-hydroxy-tetrahydrodipicolinate reductase
MADPTNIIVCGAAGRMGQAVIAAAVADRGIAVTGLVEAQGHPMIGAPVDTGGTLVVMKLDFPRVEKAVVIDFTTPDATVEHVREAVIRGFPAVIGTTGLSADQRRELEHASRKIPVVSSANMSAGVNLLARLVWVAARALKDGVDVEIIEAHHNKKKDAPSGTALMLAESAASGLGRPKGQEFVHGRKGACGERVPGEIGIHAVRGGDIAGDHTVLFAMTGERLELIHRAQGREAFARGALLAAKFAWGAKPGMYTMDHVLGLEKAG